MDQPEQKSKKVVWLAIGAFAVVALIAGIVLYAVLGNSTKKQDASTADAGTTAAPQVSVASKDQVKQNLTDLNAALKQAASDQAAAKAALKDGQNQVKVGG